MEKKIAVIKGDGIGPEIVDQALQMCIRDRLRNEKRKWEPVTVLNGFELITSHRVV